MFVGVWSSLSTSSSSSLSPSSLILFWNSSKMIWMLYLSSKMQQWQPKLWKWEISRFLLFEIYRVLFNIFLIEPKFKTYICNVYGFSPETFFNTIHFYIFPSNKSIFVGESLNKINNKLCEISNIIFIKEFFFSFQILIWSLLIDTMFKLLEFEPFLLKNK